MEPVTIILITERTQGRQKLHNFLVLPPDEIAVTVQEAEVGLLPYAQEGATVEAEYWQGKIVRLRDAAGHESRSWDDPDWLKSNNTTGVVVTGALSLVSFGLAIYIWRQAQRRRYT